MNTELVEQLYGVGDLAALSRCLMDTLRRCSVEVFSAVRTNGVGVVSSRRTALARQ
jgi:hypothetical protein